jgi:hypothetical protein
LHWRVLPDASTLTTTARGAAALAALLLLAAMLLPEKLLLLVPSITALRIAISTACTQQGQPQQAGRTLWASLLPLMASLLLCLAGAGRCGVCNLYVLVLQC